MTQLAPTFRAISHANPFFYVISGFRSGFLGISNSPLLGRRDRLLVLNVALWAACYALLKSGWKIKELAGWQRLRIHGRVAGDKSPALSVEPPHQVEPELKQPFSTATFYPPRNNGTVAQQRRT